MTLTNAKADGYENEWLKLVFQADATGVPNLAMNHTTSPATTLTIALHTADPGEAGTQLTSEATYTGYARVTVARTTGGWTVTGNSVSPVTNIDFPPCTAGTNTITHFSIGTGVSNKLLYRGDVTPSIAVANGVVPRLLPTSTVVED